LCAVGASIRWTTTLSLRVLVFDGCKNLTAKSLDAVIRGCPDLVRLDLAGCELTALPRSICTLEHLRRLDVDNNPLQKPPLEIAQQGIEAIARYFEEIERTGATTSRQLKVVLVGDGEAGKTSLRNAIAGRAEPRQAEADRTILLDLELVELAGGGGGEEVRKLSRSCLTTAAARGSTLSARRPF
jgi:Leucine-rich repeat (LRR) protein